MNSAVNNPLFHMQRPDAGNLFFATENDFTSEAVCRLSRGPAAHVGAFRDPTHTIEASRAKGEMVEWDWETRLDYFARANTDWCVVGLKRQILMSERLQIRMEADEQMNLWRYSSAELPLQALDTLINWIARRPRSGEQRVLARRLGDLWQSGIICSKAAATLLIRIKELPPWTQYASPSDLWFFTTRDPRYEIKCFSQGWRPLVARWDAGFAMPAQRTA